MQGSCLHMALAVVRWSPNRTHKDIFKLARDGRPRSGCEYGRRVRDGQVDGGRRRMFAPGLEWYRQTLCEGTLALTAIAIAGACVCLRGG